MRCIDFINQLDAYIDDEMSDEEKLEFLSHVEACDDCAAAFEEAVAIAGMSKSLAVVKAPDELLQNVMARVRNESENTGKSIGNAAKGKAAASSAPKKWRWTTLSKTLTGVAACAVVVIGVAATMSGLNNKDEGEFNYYGFASSPSATAAPMAMSAPMANYGYDSDMSYYSSGEKGMTMTESYAMTDDVKYMEPAGDIGIMPPPEPGYGGATSADYGLKIIRNGNVDLTSAEFDADMEMIESIVAAMGGYMQSSSISGTPLKEESRDGYYYGSGRYGYYTARIPSSGYGGAVTQLKGIGTLEGYSEYSDDITSQYYDTVARLESYQLQYKTIEGLLAQADNLEDVLRIQTELQNLRYMIDSLTGSIKQWDFLTTYSTLNISIREVSDPSLVKRVDPTLGERIRDSFVSSVNALIDGAEDMVVWFAGAVIVIVILAVCGGVALLIGVGVRRRRRKKLAAEKSESTEKAEEAAKEDDGE